MVEIDNLDGPDFVNLECLVFHSAFGFVAAD
jgi:hypothetical protein